jgi:hypothetical protein
MMRTYEKIETVFNRDTEGTKQLIINSYRNETVEYLKDNVWDFTEKADGTNIRIIYDGHRVSFAGRTDKADIPKPLLKMLEGTFGTLEAEELFEQTYGDKQVILFGEGYGGKIQGVGAGYRRDESFVLFDVLICENYQPRQWVEETAKMFGVKVIPLLFSGTLQDGIDYVLKHPKSVLAENDLYMEGVVARPHIEIKDRCGNRVIVKIKWRDFKYFSNEFNEN